MEGHHPMEVAVVEKHDRQPMQYVSHPLSENKINVSTIKLLCFCFYKML